MKIQFFHGITSYWGFGIDYDPFDRAFMMNAFRWYIGFEIWTNK
jgi:hypothetical protein